MTATQPTRMLLPDDPEPRNRPWWLAIAATVALIAIVTAVLVARSGDDDGVEIVGSVSTTEPVTTEPPATTAPPTTEAPATTAPPTTAPPATTAPPTTAPPATTAPPTTAPPATTRLEGAIWPPTTSEVRFDDPAAVTRSFATYWLKMTDPEVGTFRQGDSMSGEVPLASAAGGPETTVLVRRLGADGTWWVVGAVSEQIVVTEPTAGPVSSPLDVAGQAWTFEGNVRVAVYREGSTAPIATTFVTGGGDQLRPFEGTIEFDAGSARYGAVLFAEHSANDGRLVHATVVPVTFDG